MSFFEIVGGNSQDKYLGLPSMIGRNKRRLINDIKERFWTKIHGWRGNSLYFSGKEVLIKAVAQTMPTYSMSLFKIPSGICKEINSITSKFWWGSSEGKKKISWLSRKHLCIPKKRRCESKVETASHVIFGFRNAKKVWRDTKFDTHIASLRNFPVRNVFSDLAGEFHDELDKISMIFWAIWENRNTLLNCAKARPPERTALWATELLAEYLLSGQALSPVYPSPSSKPICHVIFGCRNAKKVWRDTKFDTHIASLRNFLVRNVFSALAAEFYDELDKICRPPPPGFLKLNTEAVVPKNVQSLGVGVAIRDDKGKVLVARSSLMGFFSYEIGQLLAIREGLLIAKFYHFLVSILESSSPSVISSLSNFVNVPGEG
ncbi:hypothetical protein Ddye_025476 [Dipteronia dyeriana]|uniref:RNase H type-1 domain-containing protein n=1 Tax=Dipteronia dyeriana TaxID=168575 RepID=A0AAD9WNK2_9ROSI|nr:hypothetical protein Ddye_025476 [Dipteronia dyeriana]